jgi:4-hydroxyacetophenone monooxygenase
VVIGAGISGIAACVRFLALGLDVTVLEKADDLGGVWRENRFPGAGVDTPSHIYSFSFAPHDWSQYFAGRDEIHDYLEQVADEYGVREHIRFGREVTRIVYDEGRASWDIKTRKADGTSQVESADLVISCVGAFNPPVVPALAGLEDFAGPAFHTTQWPKGLDLAGLRVGLVGNGATAMQVAPAIVDEVEGLTIFQRSPQWVQPFEKFQQKIPEPVRLLFREVPLYRAWYRLRLEWIFHDKLYRSLQRDPEFSECRTAINKANAGHRDYFTDYLRQQLADRTDLLEKVVPDYPPFGKRMLLDNGWFRTLTRPNVALVTDRIEKVLPHAVVTSGGQSVEVDVLILATGFDVVRFISTYEVIGRGGRRLRDVWDDIDCRAYLGLAIPGFPNFFTLYGPNTQTGHGGSLIHTVEAQIDYLESLLRQLFQRRSTSAECRPDVYDDYAQQVDDMHSGLIWSHPAMSTYYRNAHDRVVVINPFRNLDYWKMTRRADLGDYVVERTKGTS